MRERITEDTARPAAPSPKLLAKGLASGKYQRDDAGELTKRCSECRDYWPATTEFFWRTRNGDRLFNRCKACYIARRWPAGRSAAAKVARAGGPGVR